MLMLMLQLGIVVDGMTLTEMVMGQFMVTGTLFFAGVIVLGTIVACRTGFGAPWTSLPCRAQRVGVFNFGTDRVRVLKKYFGTDRVWIGYGYLHRKFNQSGIIG